MIHEKKLAISDRFDRYMWWKPFHLFLRRRGVRDASFIWGGGGLALRSAKGRPVLPDRRVYLKAVGQTVLPDGGQDGFAVLPAFLLTDAVDLQQLLGCTGPLSSHVP